MSEAARAADMFLGALGPHGFRGYFEALAAEPGRQMYLIKGGPGCGKSTMLKRVAAAALAAGETVVRIHCSSDPDSLDGVLLEGRNAAVVDATAPHALEPACPGAAEQVVSLYHTLDTAALRAGRAEIQRLALRCAALQKRAGCYISAAAKLMADRRAAMAGATDTEKAAAFGRRLALRYLPRGGQGGGPGIERVRLLSAVTPKGVLAFSDTAPTLADRLVVLQDEYGLASRLVLAQLRAAALEKGLEVIACPCPLGGGEAEHLFLPGLRLAFLTSNRRHPMDFAGQKNIRCARFEDKTERAAHRQRLRFDRRAAESLLAEASALQRQAKESHDRLEALYGRAVDFALVDQAAAGLLRDLGLDRQ